MSTIKRYTRGFMRMGFGRIEASFDGAVGEYVRYTDHLAAVEAAVMAERTECAAICDEKGQTALAQGQRAKSSRDLAGWRAVLLTVNSVANAIRARTTNQAKEAT